MLSKIYSLMVKCNPRHHLCYLSDSNFFLPRTVPISCAKNEARSAIRRSNLLIFRRLNLLVFLAVTLIAVDGEILLFAVCVRYLKMH